MDMLQTVRKINNRAVNIGLVYSVILLLGLNFLLYSFFDLGALRNLVRAAVAGLLGILLLFRLLDGKIRQRQILMILLALCQILLGGSSSLNIAFLLILSAAAAGYSQSRITTVVFRVMVVLSAVVLLSLILGIEKNEVYTVGTRTRNKLGFVNVNAASMFFFTLFSSYLLLRGEKARWIELTLALGLSWIVYFFTDSRTPMLGMLLMVAMYLVLPRIPQRARRILVYVAIALLFVTPYIWTIPMVHEGIIDTILSWRPQYCNAYFRDQSAVTYLVGGSRLAELDNGYLLLMFNAGIIVYMDIYFLVQSAVKNLEKNKKYMQLSYVLMMLAISVMEGAAIRPELLCAPLLWFLIIDNLSGKGRESLLLAWIRPRAENLLNRGRNKMT